MAIQAGERLPFGVLMRIGDDGPETVDTEAVFSGHRALLLGMPGAFSGTCTNLHLPSFLRVATDLVKRGVQRIVVVTGNDPWVLAAWGESTGATEAGLLLLADPAGEWIEAMGMLMDDPSMGFHRRSHRFAALVEDGTVMVLNQEAHYDDCRKATGQQMLSSL